MDLKNTSQKITRQITRNEDRGIVELSKNYRAALEDIRNEIRKLYDKYAQNGKLTYAEMTKFNRLTKLEKRIVEIMRPYVRKNNRLIDKVAEVSYEEAFYKNTFVLSKAASFDISFGLLRPEDVKAAVNNPLKRIAQGRLRQDGIMKIRRAISQGLIRGDSYVDMSRGIRDAINGNEYDARRIIRTEAGRARSEGTLASHNNAREQGIEVVDEWDATLDSRTRPEHAEMDGRKQQRHKGKWLFESPVGWIRGPRLSGVARFDINCRCALVPIVEGVEPEVAESEGGPGNKSFRQWAKDNGITASRYGQKYNFV